jgi:hypothetical protein
MPSIAQVSFYTIVATVLSGVLVGVINRGGGAEQTGEKNGDRFEFESAITTTAISGGEDKYRRDYSQFCPNEDFTDKHLCYYCSDAQKALLFSVKYANDPRSKRPSSSNTVVTGSSYRGDFHLVSKPSISFFEKMCAPRYAVDIFYCNNLFETYADCVYMGKGFHYHKLDNGHLYYDHIDYIIN